MAAPNIRIRKDGYPECITCSRERSSKYKAGIKEIIREKGRDYYDRNRELIKAKTCQPSTSRRRKNSRYLRLYGISLEKYESICKEQQHRCRICKREEPLIVDHNHATGSFRGLLCLQCNTGLGYFRDEPEYLKEAASYLIASTHL